MSVVKVKGQLRIRLKEEGKVVKEELIDNLIIDVGEQMLAYLLKGDEGTKGFVSHMGIGTGTDSPTEGDTTLQSEINRKTAAGSVTGSSVDFLATWPTGEGPYSITESGLFTASGSGNMFNRATFSTITKPDGQELELTWRITFE